MSKTAAACLAGFVTIATAPMGRWLAAATRARTAQKLTPRISADTPRGPIRFITPSKMALYWPRRAFLDEPQTLMWLDTLRDGDVLWDIGANVGAYAMYAALGRQVAVHAFEPNPFTFATLSRNVAINGLSDRISSYCIALNDETKVDRLYLESDEEGTVLNVFGAKELDRGFGLKRELEVATLGFTIDHLVGMIGLAQPTHIKIDVDNIEERIVAGASQTLANSHLRSVLIEVDSEDALQTKSIETAMAAAGLIAGERHTLMDARFYNQIFQRP